ncbi:MAG: 4Fe-4S binding protein [Dysgonamonadaceae bacterium]|nr:4Fe-4S binding protein [Dysgonamonadaceae bacterium]
MKVAIVSGKGGTGKSSITAALVVQSTSVVAVDCDVDASNLPILFSHEVEQTESFVSGRTLTIDVSLCMLCGACEQHCSFGALHKMNKQMIVNNVLCEGCGLCEYLCPNDAITLSDEANSRIYKSYFNHGTLIYGHLFPGDDNSGKMIARLRALADEEMKQKQIQLQILDGPPGIGCPVISTIIGMDKLIIVTEPTQSGLSDLKRMYQTAISFCRDISVIINKCDINQMENKALKHFCECVRLPILAEIPFDKQVVEAQVYNETIMTYAPASACAIELQKVNKQLIKKN